eukprot:Colp12_sorted_trinity150504_noHs@19603
MLSRLIVCALLVHMCIADLPDISKVGLDAVKAWAVNHTAEGELDFANSGFKRYPSPDFWGGEITYSIQVDRFNNGNLSNDVFNVPPFQVENEHSDHPYGLPDYRHGGDLQGIIDRMDYLSDLGITSLWITPVIKFNGDYHGYCTTDLTEIDPGFGTKEKFRELVQEAHKRGIKVVLDIVVNHMCDRKTTYVTKPDHDRCANDLDGESNTGVPDGSNAQGQLAFGETFFPPFRSQYFFNRCGPNSQAEMSGEGPPAVFGDFTDGMLDYDTRNFDFQFLFTEFHKYWIAYADLDGYRMDAAKHITEDFIAYFATETRKYALSIGKKNFFIVGEVAADSKWEGRRLGNMFTNPKDPDQHGQIPLSLFERIKEVQPDYINNPTAPYPGLNAVYDFSASGTARDVLLGKRMANAVEAYFSSDDYHTLEGQNDVRLSWTQLEIHDWPRFMSESKYDGSRLISGLAYLLTAEGTPIIYYGLEQGFNGDCHWDSIHAGQASQSIKEACSGNGDALKRQDMFIGGPWRLGSVAPAINNLAYIGEAEKKIYESWQEDPFLNREHEFYHTARLLTHVRRSCSALTQGRMAVRFTGTTNDGILVFSRVAAGNEIVVIVNPSQYPYNLNNYVIDSTINPTPGARYHNLLNYDQVAYTGFEGRNRQSLL